MDHEEYPMRKMNKKDKKVFLIALLVVFVASLWIPVADSGKDGWIPVWLVYLFLGVGAFTAVTGLGVGLDGFDALLLGLGLLVILVHCAICVGLAYGVSMLCRRKVKQ